MTRMTDVVLPPTFEQTASFTPGPWKINLARWTPESPVVGFGVYPSHRHPSLPDGWEMAAVASGNIQDRASFTACYEPEEIEANARLIAAAPQLLAALTECHRRLKMALDEIIHLRGWLSASELAERKVQDEVADEADGQAIDQAAAAIAAAKGGAL